MLAGGKMSGGNMNQLTNELGLTIRSDRNKIIRRLVARVSKGHLRFFYGNENEKCFGIFCDQNQIYPPNCPS